MKLKTYITARRRGDFMFRYLIINQQMPQQPQQYPQQPYPQQPAQQYPQQPMPGAQPAQPAAAPMPGAAPAAAPVSMGAMFQWAGIGGAASGVIQSIFGIISGFDLVGFLMTVGIAIALGILIAVILGQFGAKIPLTANLMIKAAAFMFVFNLITGFIFGMGEGGLGMILGIVAIGAGAFLYGFILKKKLPNLI